MKWNNDAAQIRTWIETLTQFKCTPEAGITRQLFTPEDMAARKYIIGEMEALGLKVSHDAIGNIYAVCEGTEPELALVWSGSHLDTVYHGGAFDGISGVVCAMEAIRLIKEADCLIKEIWWPWYFPVRNRPDSESDALVPEH